MSAPQDSMSEEDHMAKKKSRKNAVLTAHAEEQMEAYAKAFLTNLEHYGASGVLFIKIPDADENIFVFSASDEQVEYVKLLKECGKVSEVAVKALLDKKE